jgi:uncharacterized protein (TIGR02231 family)
MIKNMRLLMQKYFLSPLLFFTLITPVWAETPIYAISQTRKVVAYNNQAMVTRSLSLPTLSAGAHQVIVNDLPIDLISESLSVSGQGTAKALIHNIEVRPLDEQPQNPELKKLENQLENIAEQKRVLQDQQTLNREHRQFLATVGSVSDEKIRKQLAYYQIKLKDWEDLNSFLLKHHQEILTSERNIAKKNAELDKKKQTCEQEIRKLQKKGQQRKQSGVVYISVETPGNLELNLTYMVPGVSWGSTYEARLDTEKQKLRLSYFGDVRQHTQENWSNTELALSTSNALSQISLPTPSPWLLSYQSQSGGRFAKDMPAPSSRARNQNELADLTGASGLAAQERMVNFAQSEVQDKGVSIVYKIPQPVSIESSNQSRRVAIATRYFDYTSEYDVFPKFTNQAFLKIKFKNVSGMPYLAGPVRTYMNEDYTGGSTLALLLQNEQGMIPFGVDQNIKVTRKQIKDEDSQEGVLRETKRKKLAYTVEISNFTKETQSVNVYDNLPISKDDRIKVKLVEAQPKPLKITDNGLIKWNLSLAAWEKKTLQLEFWVDYPANMASPLE